MDRTFKICLLVICPHSDYDWTGNKDTGIGTDNDANNHGKSKAMYHFTPYKKEDQYNKKSSQRCDDRPAQGLIDTLVNYRSQSCTFQCFYVFPNTVKDYNGIIQGISHNS